MSLSVILPNYNHAKPIEHALEAIFSQSLTPQEVLIIDDASTDDSLSVIHKWQQSHPQIRLLQNPFNLGPVLTINRGIREAESQYLAFCSADDFILPGFFQKATDFLDGHPEIGLCSGKASHFFENNTHDIFPDRMQLSETPRVFSPQELPQIFFKTTFFIHSNCTLYRKTAVETFHGLNPNLKSYSDWYMNCQIALRFGVGYIPSYFGAFRQTPESYSSRMKKSPMRNVIFHDLMKQIKKDKLTRSFKMSGLLSHGGIHLVMFLAKHPQYYSYLPRAFLKKCHFHLNKLLKEGDPLKVEDLDSTS